MKNAKEVEKNRYVGLIVPDAKDLRDEDLVFSSCIVESRESTGNPARLPTFFVLSAVLRGKNVDFGFRKTAAKRAVPNRPDCATARV